MIGEIVGDYKLASQLVSGAVGDRFVGEHKDLGTKAAIEILHQNVSTDIAATQKYLHTIRMVSKIKHGGTLKIEDCGLTEHGRAYVVTELLDGDTLAQRITAQTRMTLPQIGEIVRQLANALAALHDDGIVHGDIRPNAVFLMKQGGLSRGEPIKLTEIGIADLKRKLGIEISPTYTAPEVLAGEPPDWRTDAYALGCVIFEMATGKQPFTGEADEVRTKHREQAPPEARSLLPDVAPALDQLIARLMSKKPDERFGSMREIAKEFEQFGGNEVRLAPTAEQLPIVPATELKSTAAGEIQTAGEIKAKAPPKEQKVEEVASIQIEGPEAEQAVTTEAPPSPILTGSAPSPFAGRSSMYGMPQKKKKASKLPLVIVLGTVVIAAIAIVIAMR